MCLCLSLSLLSAVCVKAISVQITSLTPYVKGLIMYVATYVYIRSLRSSTRHYLHLIPGPGRINIKPKGLNR